ncbi:MAG: hypothetical protein Q9198_001159 [Flavoplaca austrocitrina]
MSADQDSNSPDDDEKECHLRQTTVDEQQNVEDISTAFRNAASVLNTGQLVKDPYFTLFEAVGALEVLRTRGDVEKMKDF